MNLGHHAPRRAVCSLRQLTALAHDWLPLPTRPTTSYCNTHDEKEHAFESGEESAFDGLRRDCNGSAGAVLQPLARVRPLCTSQVLRPFSCHDTTASRHQSPRVFMLLCRSGGRPVARNIVMQSPSLGRRPISTDTAGSERLDVEARLPTDQNEAAEFELILTGPREQRASREIQGHGDVVERLSIEGTKSHIRVSKAEADVAWGKAFKKQIEQQIRVRTDVAAATWEDCLQMLHTLTPPLAVDQSVMSVEGPELPLIELYHTLLGNPTYKVTVDFPLIFHGKGTMKVAGTAHSLEDVKSVTGDFEEVKFTKIVSATSEAPPSVSTSPAVTVQGTRSRKKPMPSDSILRPGHWTKATLAEHVRALTSSRLSHLLHKKESHKDVVKKALTDIFYNASNLIHAYSWGAFHDAMTFLVKHHQTPAARQLLAHMASINFPPTVDFFNIFLHSCAKEQNMSGFMDFLKLMARDGIHANGGSWIALMTAGTTVETQQKIAREIMSKGFTIHPAFASKSAPVLTPFSFGPFLDAGGSTSTYLSTLDKIYSPFWLSTTSTNPFLSAFASRGRFLEAINLVNTFILHRNYIPDRSNLHILLRHCVRHKHVDLAIWLIVYSRRTWRVQSFDHIILEMLFQLAMNARMYNLLRVVWKYAIAAGEVTYTMRREIKASLDARLEPTRDTVAGRWRCSAGTVVCGVDPQAQPKITTKAILDAERLLYGSKPVRPFIVMLTEALFLDKKWSAAGTKKSRGTTWKLHNAIPVPIVRSFHRPKLETTQELTRAWRRLRRRGKGTKNRGGLHERILWRRMYSGVFVDNREKRGWSEGL